MNEPLVEYVLVAIYMCICVWTKTGLHVSRGRGIKTLSHGMVLAALSSPAPQRCTFALHSSKSIPRLVLYDKLPKAHNTLLQNTTEPYSNLSGQLNAIIKTLLRDGEPYMKIEAVEEAAAKSTELAMSILHRQ